MQWGCLGKGEQGPTCSQTPALAEMWHGDSQASPKLGETWAKNW